MVPHDSKSDLHLICLPRGIEGFFSTFLCLLVIIGGGVGVRTGIPVSEGSLNGTPDLTGAPLRRIVALRTESVPEIFFLRFTTDDSLEDAIIQLESIEFLEICRLIFV